MPEPKTVKRVALVVEAMEKSGRVPVAWVVEEMESLANGEVVPIPTRFAAFGKMARA